MAQTSCWTSTTLLFWCHRLQRIGKYDNDNLYLCWPKISLTIVNEIIIILHQDFIKYIVPFECSKAAGHDLLDEESIEGINGSAIWSILFICFSSGEWSLYHGKNVIFSSLAKNTFLEKNFNNTNICSYHFLFDLASIFFLSLRL